MQQFMWIVCLTGFIACTTQTENKQSSLESIETSYATGFQMQTTESYTRITVTPYQNADIDFTYYLVPKSQEVPAEIQNETIIRTPVQSIVCTSTTHIPLLEYLDVLPALKGFPNTDYISSEQVRERIQDGFITDLGVEQGINMELLLSVEPEVVMGYMVSGDKGQLEKIEQLGIPVVINAEYLETHPLGRAEWIRFAAAFFNKMDEADSIFRFIEDRYHSISAQASQSDSTPTVMSGVVYGDTWFLPGGQNYASKMIADASGRYLWAEDTTSGFLELGFEAVYDKAREADYWLGVASYASLEELKQGDDRYALFTPFQKGKVYNYNKRIGSEGGNEYFELGYLRPDIILNDLATILHPDFPKEEPLYFFQPLK